MTEPGADAAVRAFREIAARALVTNRARADVMAAAVMAGLEGHHLDADTRAKAQQAAHQVAGSAGTFGYPKVSQLAERLEQFFASGAFEVAEILTATDWLEDLRQGLAKPAEEIVELEQPSSDSATTKNPVRILIIHPDRQYASLLLAAAKARGLVALWAAGPTHAAEVMSTESPDLVLAMAAWSSRVSGRT